jgi:hypothetical protein
MKFFLLFVIIFIIFFVLINRPNERFYELNNNISSNMLNKLRYVANDLLDNTKMKFSGFLAPLNIRDYRKIINIQEGYSSFTENKTKIVLCMRDANGNLYSFNSLMYVLLHEISHVINDELHHTSKFQNIFRDLLKLAEERGYYDSNIPFVSQYCS